MLENPQEYLALTEKIDMCDIHAVGKMEGKLSAERDTFMKEKEEYLESIQSKLRKLHMAHPIGRICGAKRPKCEAERSVSLCLMSQSPR